MRPLDVRDALALISAAPTGQALVRAYQALARTGQAVVEALSEEEALRLAPAFTGSRKASYGRPAGGFVIEGRLRRILIDPKAELRIQAPLLVHELVHCTDEQYIATKARELELYAHFKEIAVNAMTAAAREIGTTPEEIRLGDVTPALRARILDARTEATRFSDRRLFLAEKKAYATLHAWCREMGERLPEYRKFLAAARASGYVFDRLVTDEEIIRIYGIDPAGLSSVLAAA